MINENELIKVFNCNNYTLFEFAKSILESKEINFIEKGAYVSDLNPGFGDMELYVEAKNSELAKILLAGIEENNLDEFDEEDYEDIELETEKEKKFSQYQKYFIGGVILLVILILYFVISKNLG